jgi:hypothetical protein
MVDALSLSQTVEHITVSCDQYYVPEWFDRLGTLSTLKKIRIEVPGYRRKYWQEHIQKKPRLAELTEIILPA